MGTEGRNSLLLLIFCWKTGGRNTLLRNDTKCSGTTTMTQHHRGHLSRVFSTQGSSGRRRTPPALRHRGTRLRKIRLSLRKRNRLELALSTSTTLELVRTLELGGTYLPHIDFPRSAEGSNRSIQWLLEGVNGRGQLKQS